MTYRDTSADITLDNANMEMSNHTPRTEKFIDSCGDYEKWRSYRDRLHEFARSLEIEIIKLCAERDASRSEIDALKMELIELRSELVKSGMERLALMDEVANLKENAKVYKWADAAMKGFSTITKEEGQV
jgi:uncharacterized coiled-coil DUF342 family protein